MRGEASQRTFERWVEVFDADFGRERACDRIAAGEQAPCGDEGAEEQPTESSDEVRLERSVEIPIAKASRDLAALDGRPDVAEEERGIARAPATFEQRRNS